MTQPVTTSAEAAEAAGAPERAGRREWLGLTVLTLPCLLVSLDSAVLNLAVPRLAADLHPSGGQLLWITDISTFLVGGSLLTMGAMADRYGRRRVLLVGAAAFAASSAVAAAATGPGVLIAARAMTGLAGATLMPATLSLIRTMFRRPDQLSLATGIWTASFSLGGVAGPLIGGLLLATAGWRATLLLAVPVVLPLLLAGPLLLPDSRADGAGRPDPVSAALSLLAVLLTVHGLTALVQDGPGSRTWPTSVVAGVVLAVLFGCRQRSLPQPLLDGALLRQARFVVPVVVTAVTFFTLYAHQMLVAQYLQWVLGRTALQAGFWTLPSVLAFLIGSLLAPVATRRMSARAVVAVGALTTGAGFAVMTLIRPGGSPATYVAASVVLSAGLGPLYTVATASAVAAAPPERAGVASAVSETGAELGGALGIAFLGSLAAAVYRHRAAAAVPSDVPASTVTAVRRTLGDALASARALPSGQAAAVRETARHAFVDGFRVVSAVSVLLLLLMALFAGRRLTGAGSHRSIRPDG